MAIWIYGLKCPIAGVIRYVGKSINPELRLRRHINAALGNRSDHHTARWLKKLRAAGLRPELILLEQVASGERWQDVERRYIASAAVNGWSLTNSTAGGEGLDYLDPEDKARYLANLSRALTIAWSTPERREEARARSIKAWADPEVTARRVASLKQAAARPDTKAKLIAAMIEVGARPGVKKAKASASKAHWLRDEYRANITKARNDPEFIAAQSSRLVARWSDKQSREALNASRWTDEARAKQAKLIVSPERTAKISASLTKEVIERRNASIKASWARRISAK